METKAVKEPEKQRESFLLEAKQVSFAYDKKAVFSNVSFQMKAREFVALIGANGSGKSTLIRLLLGLEKLQSGNISLMGTSIAKFKQWDQIGYISQKASHFNASFPGTVQEVVLANLYRSIGWGRWAKREHIEKMEEALELVGMQDYRRRLIGQLSGGQQQRVLLARSLVNQPKLLMLDEPTVSLDSKTEADIYRLLHELNQNKNIGIFLISHDLSAITIYARRLFCLGADGFFIHHGHTQLEADFLNKLYGYEVLAHSHNKKDQHHQDACPYC